MKLLSRTAILNCCIGDSGRTAWQLLCICEADPRRFSHRRAAIVRRAGCCVAPATGATRGFSFLSAGANAPPE